MNMSKSKSIMLAAATAVASLLGFSQSSHAAIINLTNRNSTAQINTTGGVNSTPADGVDQWTVNGINQINPAGHLLLRGNGRNAAPGWPTSPELDALRDAWLSAADVAEQKRLGERMQLQAFQDVPYIPLGQSISPTAFRSDISGVLNGQPVFWNVRRG